ncbi:unnamed protein product [Staurois parvus]|uniref:Uncharacterized protein n=1 Tax=Staurois parvus TaxID=386267 RepID=A0ABN9FM93_9NEOB|nr:unnamed protein product [Staurois parvus]
MSSGRCRHPSSRFHSLRASGRTGGLNRREIKKCQIKSDSIPLLYQTISHTFCP